MPNGKGSRAGVTGSSISNTRSLYSVLIYSNKEGIKQLTPEQAKSVEEALAVFGMTAANIPEDKREELLKAKQDVEESTRIRKLHRGHTKYRLQRALAEDKYSQRELAKQFGVSQSAISQFNARWSEVIEEIRQDTENEFAGLYLAEKKNRIAEYLQSVEDLSDKPQYARSHHNALRSIAEELGQLRHNVESNVNVTYDMPGVSKEDLT